MVYYYTSQNVKLMKNIISVFHKYNDITPKEFINEYVEKCTLKIEDCKLKWISDTFLGIQKHICFIHEIYNHLSEFITEEDRDYFEILLYGVTFQLSPKERDPFYKCMFNLSKPLLYTFTTFLSNNESLGYVSDVAQTCYDSNYVTEKIICPLFSWQPYLSEMAHNYAEYVNNNEQRRHKPSTVPIQPNVLTRSIKPKSPTPSTSASTQSETQAEAEKVSLKKTKPLTKNVIDDRLKKLFDENKAKALEKINEMKNENHHYSSTAKSEKYNKTIDEIKDQIYKDTQYVVHNTSIPTFKPNNTVKDTKLTLRRLEKRIQKEQQDEMKWFEYLMRSGMDTGVFDESLICSRLEDEQNRLLDIERKHLMGQISHEEAALAKQKLIDDNKRKREQLEKERKKWLGDLELWKKQEMERCRKRIEGMSLIELKALEAKQNVIKNNAENAKIVRTTTKELHKLVIQNEREELEKRIKIIKEIRVLEAIAKQARIPRIIDYTESAGFGFLSEMTLAELNEKMVQVKINLKDELDKKKHEIKKRHENDKKDFMETKQNIDKYLQEKYSYKKKEKLVLPDITAKVTQSKEISELKKVLEKKRNLRLELQRKALFA